MQHKPVTISSNEFNEKIKNNLRDYYVYQFKRFLKNDASDYRKKGTDAFKPASTFTEEKQRLLAILESQSRMEWITEKGGVCCCTVDTRMLETNPFWVPYGFCAASFRYMGWFLNTFLLLHPQIQLRRPDGLTEPIFPRVLWEFRPDAAVRMKAMSRENLQDWLHRRLEALYGNEKWGNMCMERFLSLHCQRINGRKMLLEADTERYGLTRELLQQYYFQRGGSADIGVEQFRNRMEQEPSGVFCAKRLGQRREQWRLSTNRLLLSPGDQDLRFRFQQMAGFFAQTLPLGFVGWRLWQRAGRDSSLIHYKHNYIIKALNDYNIADLLHAIEHGIWIRMEFRNGMKLQYRTMVCYPLQIRESTQNGRQYLMYYHPGYRSLGSLRLDFIDRITYGAVEERSYFAEEIALARQMLDTVWGASVPGFATGNLMHPRKSMHIRLVIRRDRPVTENRLRREIRHGRITQADHVRQTLTYEVDVADPGEMVPWVRSFSARVLEIWVDGVACHPQNDDPASGLRAYLVKSASMDADLPERHDFRDDVAFRPLKNQQYPHECLFNPLSGVAFDTVTKTVFEMMRQPDRIYYPADVQARIRRAWPAELQLQKEMLDSIYKSIMLLCSGSDEAGYRLDYIPTEECMAACDTFWDLIPRSELEASYLKGILSHCKARLFLSEQEIAMLLSGLQEQAEPISFSALHYYDQHCDVTASYQTEDVRRNFAALMDSAASGRKLETVYASQIGIDALTLTVIRLEYSKREDRFRAVCADVNSCVSFRNLERFVSVLPKEEYGDLGRLRMLADAEAEENGRRLVLKFVDERNRAERLVTEFSPWKKICTSRQADGVRVYDMELFYDVRDTLEIAVRLLSYGQGIDIVDDSGDVARQLELRRMQGKADR